MPNPTLFVCTSCNAAFHKGSQPSQGACLLEQLRALCIDESSLTIQPVNCLWMCRQACVVAISAVNQPTYVFTDLPTTKSAEALLQFTDIYRQQNGAAIPYRHIPEVLKAGSVVRIPPVM